MIVVRPFEHFSPFHVFFLILPVLLPAAYILSQVCIFIGILLFHPHFP